jgi:hypothetical protein
MARSVWGRRTIGASTRPYGRPLSPPKGIVNSGAGINRPATIVLASTTLARFGRAHRRCEGKIIVLQRRRTSHYRQPWDATGERNRERLERFS